MKKAIDLAKRARLKDEVPVGAVIVKDGKIIARAYNQMEKTQDATAHAEILAIKKACKKLNSWRLDGCEIYVTVEPCAMCAGAIVNARVGRVVFGCKDARAGAMGSVLNMPSYPLNHRPQLTVGVCENQCREILQTFFAKKRRR